MVQNQDIKPRRLFDLKNSTQLGKLAVCVCTTGATILGAADLTLALQVVREPIALSQPGLSSPVLVSQALDTNSPIALQLGDNSDAVADLQQRLADLGYYNGPVDGDFGAGTEAAVIAFQQAQGLEADGIAGQQTLATLFGDNNSSTPSPSPTDSGNLQLDTYGERVSAVQNRLRTLGYYTGQITGYFGTQTETAVIQFQRNNGLTPDGIVGPTTEATLNSPTAIAANTGVPAPSPSPLPAPSPLPLPTPSPIPAPLPAPSPSPISEVPGVQYSGRFSVIELQERLREQGYNPGPVDGSFGQQTRDAVRDAQRAYGLNSTDIRNR